MEEIASSLHHTMRHFQFSFVMMVEKKGKLIHLLGHTQDKDLQTFDIHQFTTALTKRKGQLFSGNFPGSIGVGG